jgi:O-antigen ligase
MFVAAAILTSLIFDFAGANILAAYLILIVLLSGFSSIPASARAYGKKIWTDYSQVVYNYNILAWIFLVILAYINQDEPNKVEVQFKYFGLAYIILLNMDEYPWEPLVLAACGAAFAAAMTGSFDLYFLNEMRTGGDTNPIRFGMLAAVFGAIAAVGFLSADQRLMRWLCAAGVLCGGAAAFYSGSRGALVAFPVIFVLLLPMIWRRSRVGLLGISTVVVVAFTLAFATDVGRVRSRTMSAYQYISQQMSGEQIGADRSFGDRTKLLQLSYRLFLEHPIVGVGAKGWNDAVAKLVRAPDPNDRVALPYNQAHNQYADDLAKGGIIRFAAGFLTLSLPLFFFLRCRPFSGRKGSEFALAGVVTSVAYLIFCLSESLMLLGLTATVHSILVFYLLAACDAVRQETARGKESGDPDSLPAQTQRAS